MVNASCFPIAFYQVVRANVETPEVRVVAPFETGKLACEQAFPAQFGQSMEAESESR
jgi:hypothetical protein